MLRFLFIPLLVLASFASRALPYQDLTHFSDVFGKEKTYRLYLPADYDRLAGAYPVIYFFHGWGGRHFKDESAKLDYVRLGELADKYGVILVMWDGSMDESEPRPYNIGEREDVKFQVQMKDYFPELVDHIDATYRTHSDRIHRGIIGFSMGGFMASYLAGKYPDKVSAITEMVGSPEFFVGHPENHTFYPIRYTFDNLKDVAVRFHNMDNCPLFYLNTEVKNAAGWEGLTNFEYWLGDGNHGVDEPGEIAVFETAVRFICEKFQNPTPLNKTWSHYDLYPDFNLWGYSVESDKSEPGFLFLRNVSPTGFGLYSQKWLPDGPAIKNCNVKITTAPVYKRGQVYDVAVYQQNGEVVNLKQTAGNDGRLRFELNGDGCEVSIAGKPVTANFVLLNHRLKGEKRFIRPSEENELTLTLLNRGDRRKYAGKTVRLSVSCADPDVSLFNSHQTIKLDEKGEFLQSRPVGIHCRKTPPADASPAWLKLNVEVCYDGDLFTDNLTIPVFYDVPVFKHIQIDDGDGVRGTAFGVGNGDGQANASERIMLYENYQRLRLYTDDPYVESSEEELFDYMIPAVWPDGFSFGSVVKIADNCPVGHTIEFLACYESKTFMPIRREVHWGRVRITVK